VSLHGIMEYSLVSVDPALTLHPGTDVIETKGWPVGRPHSHAG